MRPVRVFSLLSCSKQRLACTTLGRRLLAAKGCATTRSHCAHSCAGTHELLHLFVVAILKGHEALSDLEEVAVGFVGSKVDVENEDGVGSDFFLRRKHFKWVLNHLAGRFV